MDDVVGVAKRNRLSKEHLVLNMLFYGVESTQALDSWILLLLKILEFIINSGDLNIFP